MKQQKLFREKIKSEFGGSLSVGKRREARPLNFKLPAHLVLKATNFYVLLFNKTEIERLLRKYGARIGVRIYDCGIHADHIHLSGLFPDRKSYVRWIRAVTSVLVEASPLHTDRALGNSVRAPQELHLEKQAGR